MSLRILALLLGGLFMAGGSAAHEMQPAYLELKQAADQSIDVTWKLPFFKGKPLPIEPAFPDGWEKLTEPRPAPVGNALLYRWKVNPRGQSLDGATIKIAGPRARLTDVLLRAELAEGGVQTAVLRPEAPEVTIRFDLEQKTLVWGYLLIGIEHILLGLDHLLFVLGLLLIVGSTSMLVKTITSFTLAHTISLAIATFRIIEVPEAPLNACIALSILFLAPEIVRKWRGEDSFTLRHPWVVAFAFGLLHGIGFASGLSVVGLPHASIPPALLSFSLGVELGQLAFVFVVLAMRRAWKTIDLSWPLVLRRAPGYGIGILGAFWTIDRISSMLSMT